jgi:hypothetical protein
MKITETELNAIIEEEIRCYLDERCQKGYKTHPKRKTKKMFGRTYRNCVKAEGKDPKVGTGKKPKGSGRRLYTDEDPSDTVSVKFSTVKDIQDTFSKASFKSKSHKRQSQIINLVHQRVRAAYKRAKDPEVKARLKKAFDYAKKRKEASKQKTKRMRGESLRDIIKQVIIEKTRADKEGVKLRSQLSKIDSYVEETSDGKPMFYMTFTKINKVGINPRSKYNTPNGIYAYPVTKKIYDQLVAGRLPFAQEQPYVSILEPEDRGSLAHNDMSEEEYQQAVLSLYNGEASRIWLSAKKAFNFDITVDIRDASDMDVDAQPDKMLQAGSGSDPYTYSDIKALVPTYKEFTKEARKQTPFGKLWNITRRFSGGNPNVWSALWRALGYDGAIDLGTGTIHSAEPTQAVFFTRDAIEVKDTFVNKETPNKIKRRDKNEYFANAGIIAFSAFRRGGALGEFMQYKSFKIFSKYLKRALSARFKADLKLLDEIGDNLKYPWDIPQKVAGIDDIRDLEYKGIRALTKAIADTSSQTHAVFWQHPEVFNEVVGLFKHFFSLLAEADPNANAKKGGLNSEDFMSKYTYTGNRIKGFGEFQEWMKIHLEYADVIIDAGSEEAMRIINSERFKE